MTAGGFVPSTEPGQWLKDDVPVDLMVPASLLAQGPKKRSARIPPHALHAARATRGLEAALVDQDEMDVPALDDADPRVRRALVAGPSALIVAKVLKISELDLGQMDRPLQAELDSFLVCVLEGREPEVSGEDGARALALADQIAAAIREQQW